MIKNLTKINLVGEDGKQPFYVKDLGKKESIKIKREKAALMPIVPLFFIRCLSDVSG